MIPFAVDLYCGLGGWTEGLLAEGYHVMGFDIEEHVYGEHRYPAELVIQDVLTIHGSQFADVDLIVASPPCQEYSYMAMPWTRAKAKAAAIRADATGAELEQLNALFNACFRIQREACEAAGRHIPLVVENVRGAQPWVGRARWSFGSFYLWGDVPALMPATLIRQKNAGPDWEQVKAKKSSPHWTNPIEQGRKLPGFRFDGSGRSFQSASVVKQAVDPDWVPRKRRAGGQGDGGDYWFQEGASRHGSKSPARKFASAMIAKIPLPLSRHIARTYKPRKGETNVTDEPAGPSAGDRGAETG
jgi:hypothetical protein